MSKSRPRWIEMFSGTDAFMRAARGIANGLNATLHDADRIPRVGGVLVVGNHAFLGLDSYGLSALIVAHTGRYPRFLGERNLWRVPGLRSVLDAVGAIPGVPDNAVELLLAGELVGVYPGGINDSYKPSSEAYQLKWEGRSGFARVALRAKVPIVPIAATGVDEVFEIQRHEQWLGRTLLGSPKYDTPLPNSIVPKKIPFDYYVQPPIEPEGSAGDEEAVERLRQATVDAMESVLRPYREQLRVSRKQTL